jgi:sulfur-oxidizing protein SoxY
MMDVTELQKTLEGLYMERRVFLKSCSCFGITGIAHSTGLLAPGTVLAGETDPFQATSVDAVLAALGIDSPQASDQIKITAPKIAEDGGSVPVAIASMIKGTTEIITIVAKNPKPLAARNRFGKTAIPSISSRIKMGKTTDVIAVVKAGGTYYMAKTNVKVTLGGCGG